MPLPFLGRFSASRNKGWNVAIFPGAIFAPSRLRILGKSGTSLEELP